MTRKSAALTVTMLVMLAGATGRAEAGLVVNGGFEDENRDFTGWTLNAVAVTNGYATIKAEAAHGDAYGASLRSFGVLADGSLTQTIDTTIGHTYQVSLWIANLGGLARIFHPPFDSPKTQYK